MPASKNLFIDIRAKEYSDDQKRIIESEVNNHIKINPCKTKNSTKK